MLRLVFASPLTTAGILHGTLRGAVHFEHARHRTPPPPSEDAPPPQPTAELARVPEPAPFGEPAFEQAVPLQPHTSLPAAAHMTHLTQVMSRSQ